ncbi:MAG: HPF/RaiA family ribosome-associated protein [Candidatus Paceibacterota bacterium]|jgi:ribosomal subunit interface protein
MNITIKAPRHDLTEAMQNLIESKFSALDKLVANSKTPVTLSCEIEESIAVERSGAKYRAEGNLSVDGKLMRASATGMTLEDAVDQVRDELAREVQHLRGKKQGLVRRGGAALKQMLRFGR